MIRFLVFLPVFISTPLTFSLFNVERSPITAAEKRQESRVLVVSDRMVELFVN